MPGNLEIGADAQGFTLRLRVSPGARKAAIAGLLGGALKLRVCEPPERGKANAGVIALLARALSIAESCVETSAGHTSRDKQVRVRGFPGAAEELKRRLVPS